MTAHKHAAIYQQLADVAKHCKHPETWLECHGYPGDVWVRVKRGSQIHLWEDCEYRITDPDAHIINAPGTPFHGLEGPMRKSPIVNEQYWVLGAVGSWIWGGDSHDTAWLSQGRAFRTKAAREAWEAAHIKFTMGDE